MTTPAHAEPTITVYHGNCALILPQLEIQADLLLTSPPYDGVRNYGGHTFDFPTVAQACFESLAPGGILNQYQGEMCISGVLKTTERDPRNLTLPSGTTGLPPAVRSGDMYISPWL